jgi:hypothetical protein
LRTKIVATGLMICSAVAIAAPPPGTDLDSPLHAWFERQRATNGALCCSVADGHILNDDEWRATGNAYEVRIARRWYPVPDGALRDVSGGLNPTQHAVVWYSMWGTDLHIYCFAPGTEM